MRMILLMMVVFLAGCSVEQQVSDMKVYEPTEFMADDSVGHDTDDVLPDHCMDLCGDGICNEYRCIGNCQNAREGCPEDSITCPIDC